MTDSEKRRASDVTDEAFKFQMVAAQAEIKTKVELLHDMVRLQLDDHKARIIKIEAKHDDLQDDLDDKYETLKDAIAGGLVKPGILEQNRNLVKDLAKIVTIISAAGFVLLKIISPIYDIVVTRLIPQKIAATAALQPEAKSRIVRKSVGVKSVIDTDTKKQ